MGFNIYDDLVKDRILTEQNLHKAVNEAQLQNRNLNDVLIESGLLSEEALLTFLGKQLDLTFERLDTYTMDPSIATHVPESFARKNLILPMFLLGDTLTIATADPFNMAAIEELKSKTNFKVDRVLATKKNITALLDHCYKVADKNNGQQENNAIIRQGLDLLVDEDEDNSDLAEIADSAPFAILVDEMFKKAMQLKASDIHIEPEDARLRIRMRVDGILKEVFSHPRKLAPAIVSRIKVMADMDITERRRPQDGRIKITLSNKEVDFRVSSIRTIYGEKMVLRLLDKSSVLVTLEKLGFPEDTDAIWKRIIYRNSGIILVTGPTGSGKTTTLYATLNELNNNEKNLLTIEDPVEYNLAHINQVPVNVKAGVTFATGLRTILRQDPDIIMVGEIRDLETAQIAIQASQTGHLVLSTLHTNSAVGTIVRLADMGVPHYLIASSVLGILAQRLLRRICSRCIAPIKLDAAILKKYSHLINSLNDYNGGPFEMYQGRGCKACDHSGYSGRIGVYELMEVNEEVNQLIHTEARSEIIRQAAIKNGMRPLMQDGLVKLKNGLSTLDEVARVLL